MTIAAGFCYDGGLLLCADSLYTGAMRIYERKIFPVTYGSGKAVFALAGHEGYGKMAIQEIETAIRQADSATQTPTGVRRIAGDVVKSIYLEHIDLRPAHEQYECQISLLIGVWGATEGLHLYGTRKTAVIEIDTYDCLGSGDYLARYIIGPVYESGGDSELMRKNWKMSQRQAVVLALEALSAVKRYDPNCGGRSELVTISSDGSLSPVGYYHLDRQISPAEDAIAEFHAQARTLLFRMTDTQLSDEQFAELVRSFGESIIRNVRYRWKLYSEYGLSHLLGENFPPREPEREDPSDE